MELEQVSAEIRPRSDWEAVDLGLQMIRAHFGPLLRLWIFLVLPLWLPLLLIGSFGGFFWALFLIWWVKPFTERFVLFYLSRALFGEKPSIRAIWREFFPFCKQCRWLLLSGLLLSLSGAFLWRGEDLSPWASLNALAIVALLFLRSRPNRVLSLPVALLEGLKGKVLTQRVQVLSRRGSTPIYLMILCCIVEIGLFFNLLYLVDLFLPAVASERIDDFLTLLFEHGQWSDLPPALAWLLALCYLLAHTLAMWFYVGGGFALYLNARTWIEGWDVELEFRRLGRRLRRGGAAFLLLLSGILALSSSPLRADERVDEILASEDFKIEKREHSFWVPEGGREGWNLNFEGGFSLIQIIGEVFFWMMVSLAVIALIWLLVRYLPLIRVRGGRNGGAEARKKGVQTIQGLNIAPESLPDDVLSAAKAAWDRGEHRLALSLLYRGAISDLASREILVLEESATEADCLRQVRREAGSLAAYFELLTRHWVGLAYGKRLPAEAEIEPLWRQWPFGSTSGKGGSA
ncbi:MAG: DUF4129 domain-containing protein [Verrucomicrobiales bacterium]